MEWLGIRWVGVNAENGQKLLLTVLFVLAVLLLSAVVRRLVGFGVTGRSNESTRFWTRQAVALATAVVMVLGLLSIWLDSPARLSTALGLATAGLAFALQKVVTSFAGYFVILRGKTFTVGDRISMGGVRGDVIGLGFTQTTIMEMGQPPSVQSADPAMWVRSRQFTGRLVTVSNSKIFDEPVYNYTRDFPYIWEEMSLPIRYQDDRARVEAILLEVAGRHTMRAEELEQSALQHLQARYLVEVNDFSPRVFYRLTDNWLELTVRFIVREHGIRDVKDRMAREVLAALDAAGIGFASATYEIVGLPPLQLQRSAAPARRAAA